MREDRPSATALVVLRGLAIIAATPRTAALVPPEAARLNREMLARESFASRALVAGLGFAPFRWVATALAERLIPGLLLHLAQRRRAVEAGVRDALASGFGQVVVLGAGLDTLALRLAPEFPAVRFVEIDHPASSRVKRRLLAAEDLPANLYLCALDLAPETADFTDCPDFDPTALTAFVSEGLLMYLPEAAVRRLFARIAGSAPSSRAIFSVMSIWEHGRIGFQRIDPLTDRWLALRGEPFRWGLRPESLAPFLAPLGLILRDRLDPAPRGMGNASRPEANGEHVFLAEVIGE